MRCPKCQANIPDQINPCPICGQSLDSVQRPQEIIEPELVGPGSEKAGQGRPMPGWSQEGQQNIPGFTRIFYTTFPGGNGIPTGCLPSIVTLVLTLAAAFSYGLLAAIGFLVFAAIGRAVTFSLTVRQMMLGRMVNPWVFHIVTWAICWGLVAWLSGNL